MLKGSHKLGRIEHKKVGEQIGADVERVEQVMKVRRREDGKGSVFDFSVEGTSSGGGGDGTR